MLESTIVLTKAFFGFCEKTRDKNKNGEQGFEIIKIKLARTLWEAKRWQGSTLLGS
jgi:hypothetical protein